MPKVKKGNKGGRGKGRGRRRQGKGKLKSVHLASVPLDGAGAVTLKSRAHSKAGRNLTDVEYLQAEVIEELLNLKCDTF